MSVFVVPICDFFKNILSGLVGFDVSFLDFGRDTDFIELGEFGEFGDSQFFLESSENWAD